MLFSPRFVKDARERRNLIKKVFFYRRQHLAAADLAALQALLDGFASAIRAKDEALLQRLTKDSETLLQRVGGHYFRHFHWFENVETFVVAAILAIGIRSFFLQPFKIPTNSMWPTYHGMVYTLTPASQPVPGPLQRVWQLAVRGISHFRAVAPVSGTVRIPVFTPAQREAARDIFAYQSVTRPFFGILPLPQRQYTFYVEGTPVSIFVPAEFSLDKLLIEKFFPSGLADLQLDSQGMLSTGTQARAGEAFLSFQLETGDMLFVDRVSYQFLQPQVGQPIVFRTRAIPGLTALNGGQPDDKYYIKRLVGLPGDDLRVVGSTLYRNDEPITGSSIFAKDFNKTPPYPGYQAAYSMEGGATVRVPAGNYFAMGDNSPESLDSRAWGGLPQHQLIGRAIFIYYPFSSRWGFSR